jgi:adenylate cyclase
VLIGGEIDKVVSILLVTGVLTAATARARTLLNRSVTEGAAAAQLSRFFAPEVAATIVAADEALRPGQGRQTEAAAMFLDMRGFTRLAARLAPSELIGLLGEYQNLAVPAIQENGGSIDGYLGDGIMATFGATRESARYAANAMRAAERLLEDLGAWAEARARTGLPAPDVGIGIAVGNVICGAVGDDSRLEYTVIGDAVNTAAKLQTHTKVENVRALATAAALDLAVSQGYVPPGAPRILVGRAVAGIERPLDIAALG